MIETTDVFLRIGVAGACGALIGLERESRNQLAGMRTHALVAAGAAVFTLAGAHGFPEVHRGPNVDPMRIGAGAIIRDHGSVRGVTTAAALWTSAALGLAAGAGLWWVAGAGALITLLVLVGLRPLRSWLVTPLHTIDIDYQKGHGTLGPVLHAIRDTGAQLDDLDITDSDNGTRRVAIDVRLADAVDLADIVKELGELPEVSGCAVRKANGRRRVAVSSPLG
jgi:putative Mg2+ transporter-C (MgtC) family protein